MMTIEQEEARARSIKLMQSLGFRMEMDLPMPENDPDMARSVENAIKRGKCDSKCTHARHEKCVCSCGGKNHGSALKSLKKLDDFQGEGIHE